MVLTKGSTIPYEVDKVVKKTIKEEKKTAKKQTTPEAKAEEINVTNYTFEVSEDTDTRDGSKIYLVKVAEKLSREEYIKVNQYIKSIGGYLSRFKHSFLFKEDPTEKLNTIKAETETGAAQTEKPITETTTETDEMKKESVSYTITEDVHTKTGETIWIVKPEKQLSKINFAEVRRNFATLKGYYSSYVKGFIFKYDPTEKIKIA